MIYIVLLTLRFFLRNNLLQNLNTAMYEIHADTYKLFLTRYSSEGHWRKERVFWYTVSLKEKKNIEITFEHLQVIILLRNDYFCAHIFLSAHKRSTLSQSSCLYFSSRRLFITPRYYMCASLIAISSI